MLDAVYTKTEGMPCFLFDPQHSVDAVLIDRPKFMVPTYRVKRTEVEAWLEKLTNKPPNPLGQYEGVLVAYLDQDGGEPRFGGAVYRVSHTPEL